MKALRVLTGAHAGAQIRLTSGDYRLGAGEEADVCISDWQVEDLTLTLSPDGVVRAWHDDGEEVLIADFVAVPYGDVVFCVGPDDDSWPRDIDLMAGLLKTAEKSLPAEEDKPLSGGILAGRPKAIRTAGVALACTALAGGLLTAGLMLISTQQSQAANIAPVGSDSGSDLGSDVGSESSHGTRRQLAQLRQALTEAGLTDLHATSQQGKIVVAGMVRSGEDNENARRIMDRLLQNQGVRQYDVADQDVDNISQSLAGTGARVSYQGHGVFRVSGSVPSMKQFQQLLSDVRADLDGNVKHLEVQVQETKPTSPQLAYAAMVDVGGLRYVETPDGTKHFFDTDSDSTTAPSQ